MERQGLLKELKIRQGEGDVFFISYLDGITETFSLRSVGIPSPCAAFELNKEENFNLVVLIIAH